MFESAAGLHISRDTKGEAAMSDKRQSVLLRGILQGLNSPLGHAKGKPTSGAVEHVVLVPDVKPSVKPWACRKAALPRLTTFRFLP